MLTGVKSLMKKTRTSQLSARPNIRGEKFIKFSFNSLSFALIKKLFMKKWIVVCGGPLYSGLNALLHIAFIFTTHGKRNVVIFYINFSFIKVFKENNYCRFFQTVFCLCAHNVFLLYHLYYVTFEVMQPYVLFHLT